MSCSKSTRKATNMTIQEFCKIARMLNYNFKRNGREHHQIRRSHMYWDKVERLAKKEDKYVAVKH